MPQGSLDVLVCEALLPASVRSAKVDGRPVPLLKRNVRKVLILGDTGCRLVERGKASEYQNCNDPGIWPFRQRAAEAARLRPDLVIHVGDYLYRESPCPTRIGCEGTASGNGWLGWKADFFDPAAPLLRAAPWIFVRGNHEDCTRAWDGWFRFLHPGPMPTSNCETHSPPYHVDAGRFHFAVMDSTVGSDDIPKPADVAMYQKDLDEISTWRLAKAWLVTHRPFWGIRVGPQGAIRSGSATLDEAWRRSPALGIAGVLSGHIHALEWVDFGPHRPVQFVIGNSGTKLLDRFSSPTTNFQLDRMRVDSASVQFASGFAVMQRTPRGVSVDLLAGEEHQKLSCKVDVVATCVKLK